MAIPKKKSAPAKKSAGSKPAVAKKKAPRIAKKAVKKIAKKTAVKKPVKKETEVAKKAPAKKTVKKKTAGSGSKSRQLPKKQPPSPAAKKAHRKAAVSHPRPKSDAPMEAGTNKEVGETPKEGGNAIETDVGSSAEWERQNLKRFVISNSLKEHPVKAEKAEFKKKYLSVLRHFADKFSKGNKVAEEMAKEMLKVYKKAFGDVPEAEDELEACIEECVRWRLKLFKFKRVTHGFCLICDILTVNNAFEDNKLAKRMLSTLKEMTRDPKHHARMDELVDVLYENADEGKRKPFSGAEPLIKDWRANRAFVQKRTRRILVTGNMSSGKSTLMNALVGKEVCKMGNEATTSKIHYVRDKAFEDGHSLKWDGAFDHCEDGDSSKLIKNNEENRKAYIRVATHFSSSCSERKYRLCIIDTPGTNSAGDEGKKHRELTEKCIEKENYEVLIYVMGADTAEINDNLDHLRFVWECVSKKKLEKVIFVLNYRSEKFKKSEETVDVSIEKIKKDLVKIDEELAKQGLANSWFKDPIIRPISAYVGWLAKKKAFTGQSLSEDETDEYKFMKDKLDKQEYGLARFYGTELDETKDVISSSGIYGLEQMLFN